MTARDALDAHPDIARLVRSLATHPGRTVVPDREVQYAAIAVILRLAAAGGLELLLVRRAAAAGDPWSGHIACPGGRRESVDADLAATAIRETREETAIDLARDGRILGTLDDIRPRTPVLPPILVRPFVAALAGEATIVQSREIAGYRWVPLPALIDPANWGTAPITIPRVGVEDRPVFRYQDFVVWGMTEWTLRQLVQRVTSAESPP